MSESTRAAAKIFSLEVLRARHGDCLLLHFGTTARPQIAIIDGGADSTYADHLRPRLIGLRQGRGLSQGEPLPVDLLMVTHLDADHITGILDLTRELVSASHAPLVDVLSFWNNSFDSIIGNTPEELLASFSAQFGPASLSGNVPDDATLDAENERDAEVARDTFKVLASIAQNDRLKNDAERLGLALNPEFDGALVLAGPEKRQVATGLSFIVAGPMQPELLALQKKHDEWLEQQQRNRRPDAEALAAYVDVSVPNLSSIVVLATFSRKKMLLTGDARGDRILAGLEAVGVLKPGKTIHVNVLKVPHHGSAHNVAPDFFKRITADHYVFSGNGRHGNPERETIEMLLAARPRAQFQIHLTYPLEEIDEARRVEWVKQQNLERDRRASGRSNVAVREDWSAQKQGLVALFGAMTPARSQMLHIVKRDAPHFIDLLEPLDR